MLHFLLFKKNEGDCLEQSSKVTSDKLPGNSMHTYNNLFADWAWYNYITSKFCNFPIQLHPELKNKQWTVKLSTLSQNAWSGGTN